MRAARMIFLYAWVAIVDVVMLQIKGNRGVSRQNQKPSSLWLLGAISSAGFSPLWCVTAH